MCIAFLIVLPIAPAWVLLIVLLIVGAYCPSVRIPVGTFQVPGDTNTEPAKAVPSGPSAADLEGELRPLVAGLGAVAGGRGGSGLFGKIQAIVVPSGAIWNTVGNSIAILWS